MTRINPLTLAAGLFLLAICISAAIYEFEPASEIIAMVKASITASARVTRGQESWNYIYIFLGFVLAIGGTIISMIPDAFPWNIVGFVVFTVLCVYLFLFNGSFQNKLIGLKASYENVGR